MSQWSNAQGHPSIFEHDGDNRSATTSAHSRHGTNNSSGYPVINTASPSARRLGPGLPSRSLELPPLMRAPASPAISRPVTLPSVLNPITDENPAGNQRRRKAEEIDSPREGVPTLPPLISTSHGPGSTASSGGASPLPLLTEPVDRAARRMLNPKSPLRRAISLSHLNPPSGTVDAHQNPFPASPRSQPYMIDTRMSGAPGSGPGGAYGLPGILQTEHIPRPASPEASSAQRYSASPSPAYSSYTQDQTSPTGDLPMPGYLSVSDPGRGSRDLSMPPGSSMHDSYQVPMGSGPGQSTYQMMTLKTSEGDVRFPVDVQAASRVADEKRRRNAGASARFRERRKRKEMEASATIAKLEQQLKEFSEDADFYKRERDMLASIMVQLPGGREHLPRPQSPRARRNVSMPTGTGRGLFKDADTTSSESGRNVRKRTSSFPSGQGPHAFARTPHMNYAPPPPSTAHVIQQHFQHPQHTQMHAHGAGNSSLPPPPPPPPPISHDSGPPNVLTSAIPHPPPPSLLQAPPMTGPVNPFARSDFKIRPSPHG